jgi:hypothetical protein
VDVAGVELQRERGEACKGGRSQSVQELSAAASPTQH